MLKDLQDNVPAFSGDVAQEIIEGELGKPLDQIFDKFDKNLSDSIDFEEFIEVGIWIHNELPKQKLN